MRCDEIRYNETMELVGRKRIELPALTLIGYSRRNRLIWHDAYFRLVLDYAAATNNHQPHIRPSLQNASHYNAYITEHEEPTAPTCAPSILSSKVRARYSACAVRCETMKSSVVAAGYVGQSGSKVASPKEVVNEDRK